MGEMRYSEAIKEIMRQHKVGRSAATRAIGVARLLFAQEEEAQRPGAKAIVLERLERIADKAEAVGNYNAAVRAMREIIRVRGLAAPEEVIISQGLPKRLRDMTDEEIRALAKIDEAAPPQLGDGSEPDLVH